MSHENDKKKQRYDKEREEFTLFIKEGDKIIYPEEFKNRVKAAYPNFPDLHLKLDQGSMFVGRYLDDGSSEEIDPRLIHGYLTNGRSDELLSIAKFQIQRQKLYAEWCDRMGYGRKIR